MNFSGGERENMMKKMKVGKMKLKCIFGALTI